MARTVKRFALACILVVGQDPYEWKGTEPAPLGVFVRAHE
jgi:hypothetical protein